uniref:Uncharacterized protein n=1 Tax=Arundo donax TaxID=35708 RepID=A0A0A9E1M9_ARUDO
MQPLKICQSELHQLLPRNALPPSELADQGGSLRHQVTPQRPVRAPSRLDPCGCFGLPPERELAANHRRPDGRLHGDDGGPQPELR